MQVAFYKGRKRLFNRLVCWWLKGPYSHVELVATTFSDGVSVCISASFMDGGVRAKHMVLNPDHWDFVDVPDDPGVWDWLMAHEDKGYDLLGLLGFVWRRQTGEHHRFFCSEAVGDMLGFPESWRFDTMNLYSALKGLPCLVPKTP